MKNVLVYICLFLPMLLFSQENNSIQIIEPIEDDEMQALVSPYSDCDYIDNYEDDLYIINNHYAVYENCRNRKVLFPDFKSFRFPKHNEKGFFAIDKNGIYFRGEKIKTDTIGFAILGYKNDEVLWKTKDAVYKNTKKINVSDVATFEGINESNYTKYFKDKNFVYYFDKKIENSDGATVVSVEKCCSEFTYDKKNTYFKGNIITYDNEKIAPVNNSYGTLYKTSKQVLFRGKRGFVTGTEVFDTLPGDAQSIRALSDKYYMDKNHVYLRGIIVPIKKENLQNVKVWGREYFLSDGEKIYQGNYPQNHFDTKSFEVLSSDFCFDKNGIYEIKWTKGENTYHKLPFQYVNLVGETNTFMTKSLEYIIYENQAYDTKYQKLYKNLSNEQIKWARENKLRFEKISSKGIKIEQKFEYPLYKANNKIYYNDNETIADANTFERVSGAIYRDMNNVYLHFFLKGLFPIQGINSKTIEPFNGFVKDDTYLFFKNRRIIKSKDLEMLGVFKGYRTQCSQDTTSSSDYFLFRNFEGFWLVKKSNNITVRNLGKKLPNQNEWIPNLKEHFE